MANVRADEDREMALRNLRVAVQEAERGDWRCALQSISIAGMCARALVKAEDKEAETKVSHRSAEE